MDGENLKLNVSLFASIPFHWYPFVLFSDYRKSNIFTALSRWITTECNSLNSHAKDAIALHPAVAMVGRERLMVWLPLRTNCQGQSIYYPTLYLVKQHTEHFYKLLHVSATQTPSSGSYCYKGLWSKRPIYNLMFYWPCIMNWLYEYINYQRDALIIIFIHKILFSSTCF